MCSRICKHNYRITIIVKIGYRDHSPAGLVVTGVPLARDDMHSPQATGRPLSIHPEYAKKLILGGSHIVSEEINLRGAHIVCEETELRGPPILSEETVLRGPPI